MAPERFKRLSELFAAALEHASDKRAAYINEACGGDEELKAELVSLLDAHERASEFLVPPAEAETVTQPSLEGDLPSGTLLKERYRVERRLDKGGFATVYLGHDTQLHDKLVIIKVLREHLERQWVRTKFRDECKALARINHPGVVGVLDQGETAEGILFLVMEFVDGVTLRSVITPEGMEFGRVASLIRQIGEALQAAHDKGVYHRDLKPANIVLRDLGRGQEMPVIIDFGIATVKDSAKDDRGTTRVAGSFAYMAPEQHLGHPVAASDIYALGVIAYEMVTGRRPFDEKLPAAALFQSQQKGVKINPRSLRPALPEAAEEKILKALAFNPQDRFVDAAEFGEEVARALDGEKPEDRSLLSKRPFPTRRQMVGMSASAVAVFAAATLGPRIPWPPWKKRTPERALSYYVLVQKYRNGKPFEKSFPLAKEMLFPPGYRIRLFFRTSQDGYLYLVNEGPSANGRPPIYNVLFPSPVYNAGSSFLLPDQEISLPPGDEFFVFDKQHGEEKIWLIWARQSIPEMEAVKKWVNWQDRGTIKDASEADMIKNFLVHHSVMAPKVEKDTANARTLVRVEADILVHLLRLEHD